MSSITIVPSPRSAVPPPIPVRVLASTLCLGPIPLFLMRRSGGKGEFATSPTSKSHPEPSSQIHLKQRTGTLVTAEARAKEKEHRVLHYSKLWQG